MINGLSFEMLSSRSPSRCENLTFAETISNFADSSRRHLHQTTIEKMSPASASRPYRSSKRNKPCDRCRETKTRCQVIAGSHCAKCQREGIKCSFAGSGRSRKHGPIPTDLNTPTPGASDQDESWTWSQSPVISTAVGSTALNNDRPLSAAQPTPPEQNQQSDIQFNTQFSQSLERLQLEGYSAQLFGSSSECDPWLLRHCKFDDFGTRSFQSTHFRNAGGVPLADKIPIHLSIEPTELSESARAETRAYDQQIASREELNHIVPLECGQRLIAL